TCASDRVFMGLVVVGRPATLEHRFRVPNEKVPRLRRDREVLTRGIGLEIALRYQRDNRWLAASARVLDRHERRQRQRLGRETPKLLHDTDLGSGEAERKDDRHGRVFYVIDLTQSPGL